MTATQTEGLDMTDEQILAHFEMPGLNLEATLDAHDLGLLLTGMRALLSASKPAAPEGWKLVPVEPTEDMVVSGFESRPDRLFSKPEDWEAFEAMTGCQQAAHKARLCYAAMIEASPTAPAQPCGEDAANGAMGEREAFEKLGREFKDCFGHITPEEALRAINARDKFGGEK